MKKLVFTLVSLFALTVNASAMSFEQAQEQALFLTDKMAYELNLTPEQYDAAYEINLDYLMGITTSEDVFNEYWTRRNLDLSYVLLDWQYRTFCDALYFYRPLYWDAGFWHFRIYARYPHRSWFYFDRPTVYISYHGEHCWRHFGDRGYYHGRVFVSRGTNNHSRGQIVGGMRDSWNGKGRTFDNRHNNGGNNRGFRNNNIGNHNGGNNGGVGERNHNGGVNNSGFGNRNNNGGNRSGFGNPSSTRETVTPRRNPSISQNQSTTTNLNRGNMVSSNRSSSMSSTRSSSISSSSTMSTPSHTPSSTMSTPSRSSSSSFGSSTRSMSSHSSSFGGGSRSGGGGFGSSHGSGGARGGFGGGGHR